MKTIKTFSLLALLLIFVSACAGDSAKKVADKLNSGMPLDKQDYSVMIDYCGKYATEAQQYQNQIDMLPDSAVEATKDAEALADLTSDYPYLDMFNKKIAACTAEEVGKENADKINKYASLIWFAAPDWATVIDNKGVDGFIEDTPEPANDTVIANGDGVAVSE